MNKDIDHQLFEELISLAKSSPRKRSHKTFHQDHQEAVQRIFIGLSKGTYVKAHRHPLPGKWEMIMALKGQTGLVLFDDSGKVIKKYSLSPGDSSMGVELPENTWHTVYPIDEDSVIMEVKAGPFIAEGFSEFADWAPEENTEKAQEFLTWIEYAEVGKSFIQS